MIRNLFIAFAIIVTAWLIFHHPKANWQDQLAPNDPQQSAADIEPWPYKDYTITPRAKYHIKAVILSKHEYRGGFEKEDTLSDYDLALGWGPMSDGSVINQLNITQGGRWYYYSWSKAPPIDPSDIVSHSSNHHIIAADQDVLEAVQRLKLYDVVDMEGYLVDIQSNKENWFWHTSLSRFDSGEGSCKLFWVIKANSVKPTSTLIDNS